MLRNLARLWVRIAIRSGWLSRAKEKVNPVVRDRAAVAVIMYVHVSGETIYLLSIYDKSEKDNLDEGELAELLDALDLS